MQEGLGRGSSHVDRMGNGALELGPRMGIKGDRLACRRKGALELGLRMGINWGRRAWGLRVQPGYGLQGGLESGMGIKGGRLAWDRLACRRKGALGMGIRMGINWGRLAWGLSVQPGYGLRALESGIGIKGDRLESSTGSGHWNWAFLIRIEPSAQSGCRLQRSRGTVKRSWRRSSWKEGNWNGPRES